MVGSPQRKWDLLPPRFIDRELTDFERGMRLVNALVGAVTLGQGALALDFTKIAGKDVAVELL